MNSPKRPRALYTSSLIELGLILFFITFIVLACAQLMLRALEAASGKPNDRQPSAFICAAASPTASSSRLSFARRLFGLVWLGFILCALLSRRLFRASRPPCSPRSTPPPGQPGGLANAIFGSVMMSVVAVLLGTPIGLFAGTYLAEYGRIRRFAFVVRFVNDILLQRAVHRHRPVHLRNRGRADGPFLGLGRRRCR